MTLCSTGSLSICGTAGTNRSISTEVSTGSGSLSALSASADFSAPHSMLEFYGFTATFPISLSSICSIPNTNCLSILCGGDYAGSCYSLTIDYYICLNGAPTSGGVCVICNSVMKYSCTVNNSTGNFPAFVVIDSDNICICTRASAPFEDTSAVASSNIVGTGCIAGSTRCYCVGSPSGQVSSEIK